MNRNQISFIKRNGFLLSGVFLLFILLGATLTNAFAAESDLDGSYLPTVNNVIFSIVVQPDGKAVIGGSFTNVNGQTRNYITRLNTDGTIDTTFNPALAPNSPVLAIVRQPDGKFIVGGQFTAVNGSAKVRIVRLNADGTIDNTFNSSVGADNQVLSLALLSNGQILVGGDFLNYSGTAHTYLVRINSDGSLDNTFNAVISSQTSSGTLRVIVPMSDGTIYIGGGIGAVNSVNRQFIARLNSNGSIDTTFNPGISANSFIETILPISGQILVGGSFSTFNNQARGGLARLNGNGTLDATYNPPITQNSTVYNLTRQSAGKILASGSILGIDGNNRRGIVRLNPDGSSDAAFNVNAGTNGTVNATALQPDGKILIGGQFLSYNGVNQARLARLTGAPPTAARAVISGQVLGDNAGLPKARVQLIDTNGTIYTAVTNPFGYFQFENVETGRTYIISVSAKHFDFNSRTISITDDISGLTFVGSPSF